MKLSGVRAAERLLRRFDFRDRFDRL